MTIKLGNLADWRVLEGEVLSYRAPDYDKAKPRRVRLDLNCERGYNMYIAWPGADPQRFVAAIPAGLSTLEFISDGDFDLVPVRPEFCEIQYWTSEAESFWTEGDGETFSTIYERQPRNEALEWVQFQAMQNQLRRDKAHAEELAAIRAEVGALRNGEGTGVHGEPPAEHKKRKKGGAKSDADGGSGDGAAGADGGGKRGDTSPSGGASSEGDDEVVE